MPAAVVLGTQWGDEGKGKAVDYLADRMDFVVRYQGGNNAGYTIIAEGATAQAPPRSQRDQGAARALLTRARTLRPVAPLRGGCPSQGCSVWVREALHSDTNDPHVRLDPHLHDPNPLPHSERLGVRQLPVEHRRAVLPWDVVNLRGAGRDGHAR
jgi:hypothetical protein